jgi:hypothetical protein
LPPVVSAAAVSYFCDGAHYVGATSQRDQKCLQEKRNVSLKSTNFDDLLGKIFHSE